MPYISFKTTKTLTLQQELSIKDSAGELITMLPGKTEDRLMLHMEDNQVMYFQGTDEDCMMISLKSYQALDLEKKKAFVEAFTKSMEKITLIPSSRIYMTVSEYENWGTNGTLK